MSGQNQNFTPAPGSYPGKGMAIAALVLGIVSIVIGFFVPFLNIVCAVVALVLGIISKKKAQEVGAPTGMATAGLVLGIISLAISIVFTICVVCLAGAILAEFGALGL